MATAFDSITSTNDDQVLNVSLWYDILYNGDDDVRSNATYTSSIKINERLRISHRLTCIGSSILAVQSTYTRKLNIGKRANLMLDTIIANFIVVKSSLL